MWLYHGTYDTFYNDIKKCGVIKVGVNKDRSTEVLDTFINSTAHKQLRGNCIYLTADKRSLDGYDRSIAISTKWLDISKLFVANNRCLDFAYAMFTQTGNIANDYTLEYINSYMTFEQYLKTRNKLSNYYLAEFLYFGDIPLRTQRK